MAQASRVDHPLYLYIYTEAQLPLGWMLASRLFSRMRWMHMYLYILRLFGL